MLTTFEGERAIDGDRGLIDRAGSGIDGRAIIDLVTTIMVYKFNNLTRDEVDAMLGIELKETRVYQDANDDGRVEEAQILIFKQLTHKLGELTPKIVDRINCLSIEQLESLGIALFDLSNMTDLDNWLDQ